MSVSIVTDDQGNQHTIYEDDLSVVSPDLRQRVEDTIHDAALKGVHVTTHVDEASREQVLLSWAGAKEGDGQAVLAASEAARLAQCMVLFANELCVKLPATPPPPARTGPALLIAGGLALLGGLYLLRRSR